MIDKKEDIKLKKYNKQWIQSKKLKSLIEYSLNDKKLKMKIKKLKSDYYNTNSINKCYDILTKIDMTDKKILINSF